MMNSSNHLLQTIPERIDLRLKSNPSSDARIEGGLPDSEIFVPTKKIVNQHEAGKELSAASALTSLVKSSTDESFDNLKDDFDVPERFTKSGRKKAIPFPMKLMKVLSQSEYSDIISWLPDGKSFNILKPKAFVTEILPGHFKQAKYSSFTRKLHRWGFQRHLRGEEAGAFYHNLFQRGMPDLLDKMTCYKSSEMIKHTLPLQHRDNVSSSEKSGIFDDFQHVNKSFHQQECSQDKLHHSPVMQGDVHQKMQSSSKSFSSSAESPVSRLNAAIELEVSRRLRERSSSLNFSRPNLPIMQQSHFPVSNNDLSYGGHMFFSNGMNLSNNSLGQTDIAFHTTAQQQQLQLQLQQQQEQLRQLQQLQAQLQQQGLWEGHLFGFEGQGH